MPKEHMTDDGPKVCVAQSESSCRATFNGNNAPHFENHEAAMAYYGEYLEKNNSAFVSFRRSTHSARATVVDLTVDVDTMTAEQLVDYASSSPDSCKTVGDEIKRRIKGRRWELNTLNALRPGNGSPVTDKTYKLLSDEVRLQDDRTFTMLDAHMSSPHYRSSVKTSSNSSNTPGSRDGLWCRKMLDDHAGMNDKETFYYDPSTNGSGMIGMAHLPDGGKATVEAYPSADSASWQSGPPADVLDAARSRARERGAQHVRVLALLDGHENREYSFSVE